MVMKRQRILDLYRSGPPALPAGSTDARILAEARTPETQRPLRLVLAATAALAAILMVRWYFPGEVPAPGPTATDFGIAEGQASAWLTTYQPPATATGFGSREGLP